MRKPQNATSIASSEMMTMPTVAVMVLPSITADSAWPPMVASTTQNPVRVARFRSTSSETKYFPKAKRACTSWRMPVLGPQVHIAATGTVDTSVKKRMTRAASRKFRPNDAVPTMPKVTLTMLASLSRS